MNPFDYLNSINSTKQDIMVDDSTERGYNPYIVNRSLSYFSDTVLLANEMNRYHHLDKKLQYHFFINTIRKRKRFAKFIKPSEVQDIEVIKEYYGYSDEKAKQVLSLLNGSQLSELHLRINKGGKSK
jgi:hypothetical protein